MIIKKTKQGVILINNKISNKLMAHKKNKLKIKNNDWLIVVNKILSNHLLKCQKKKRKTILKTHKCHFKVLNQIIFHWFKNENIKICTKN